MRYLDSGATFSPCGLYRYRLWREWPAGMFGEPQTAAFWLCNPSTADATADDPTIRRCVGFARRWGCNRLEIGNVHAYRATDPRELQRARNRDVDVVGPRNEEFLCRMADENPYALIAAWGTPGRWVHDSDSIAGRLYRSGDLQAFALNADGTPAHPLYQPYRGARLPPRILDFRADRAEVRTWLEAVE